MCDALSALITSACMIYALFIFGPLALALLPFFATVLFFVLPILLGGWSGVALELMLVPPLVLFFRWQVRDEKRFKARLRAAYPKPEEQ
jgi:hypothetical protein